MTTRPRKYFFGCWNTAGHYLFLPGGSSAGRDEHAVCHYGDGRHIDGTLAPRQLHGIIVCGRQFDKKLYEKGSELPCGYFLRHVLDNGFTAIQWWDRSQGDTRGACNSTLLLEGDHPSEVVLALLQDDFSNVNENIRRGGPKHAVVARQPRFELKEVQLGSVFGGPG